MIPLTYEMLPAYNKIGESSEKFSKIYKYGELFIDYDVEYLKHKKSKQIVVSIIGYGLCSYGKDRKEAADNLHELLDSHISWLMEQELLEKSLKRSKLHWGWL